MIDRATPALAALALAAVSTVPVALAFLPLYVRAERVVDRLLYGTRPTPYSVLAGIAALSRGTGRTDAPDLARVAEAVGRGLGATACRLTVLRPGLRDRVYSWAEPGLSAERIGRWSRSRCGTAPSASAPSRSTSGAVAGLHGQRQHLLEDVADSLGAVFQASRSGIELERQLRAALAYAGGIAVSRRAVVAEMDWERRRIERDLHDGAQHHLVSLRLALGLVEHQVSTAQLEQARSRLAQIADQIEVAEEILAETAKGVSSPLLAELGLVRALRQELGGGQPPVPVDAAAWTRSSGSRPTSRPRSTSAAWRRSTTRASTLRARPSGCGWRPPDGSAALHRARRGSGLGHDGQPPRPGRPGGACATGGPADRGGRPGRGPLRARRRHHRGGRRPRCGPPEPEQPDAAEAGRGAAARAAAA